MGAKPFFSSVLAAIWASFGARDTWETVNSIIICLPSYPGGLTSSRAVCVCACAFPPLAPPPRCCHEEAWPGARSLCTLRERRLLQHVRHAACVPSLPAVTLFFWLWGAGGPPTGGGMSLSPVWAKHYVTPGSQGITQPSTDGAHSRLSSQF